jgi:DNA-binding MarR family transcriptional regulator
VRNRSTSVKRASGAGSTASRPQAADHEASVGQGPAGNAALAADAGFGLLFDVWLLGRATVALVDRQLVGEGLSADEFPVYCLLEVAGPQTPSSLATWMAAPATTVSAFVQRLESRGHVERVPNSADGRSYLLRLTAEGRRVQARTSDRFAPLVAAVESAVRDPVASRQALLELRKTLDGLRANVPPGFD